MKFVSHKNRIIQLFYTLSKGRTNGRRSIYYAIYLFARVKSVFENISQSRCDMKIIRTHYSTTDEFLQEQKHVLLIGFSLASDKDFLLVNF